MATHHVNCVVEGTTDEPVAEKLLQATGLSATRIMVAGGKPALDRRLPGLNRSATRLAWLVIRDLDQDDRTRCIPALTEDLLGGPAGRAMCFRLAVRSLEAWLLADHVAFAEYFAVTRALPHRVDELDDPKTSLINLCRRSRKKDIKEGIPPRPGSRRSVGPEYAGIIQDFGRNRWRPDRARRRSPSLDRALKCLTRLRALLDEQSHV